MIITLKGKLISKTIILNPKWKKPKSKNLNLKSTKQLLN